MEEREDQKPQINTTSNLTEDGRTSTRRRRRRRVVLFPLPFQGHVNPMLHLASLLYSKGFSITIIQTHFNSIHPNNFPHFTFLFIDDGLTPEALKADSIEMITILISTCSESFRACFTQMMSEHRDSIACLIVDQLWVFARAVAQSFNLFTIAVRTGSMSAFVVYDSLPLLRAKGYYPIQEAKLDETIPELPPLKFKDLPLEPMHELLSELVESIKTSQAIVCNTFEELESDTLARVEQSVPIPVFSIGPLHKVSPPAPSSSIPTQEQTLISWLDTQAPKSVLYVSFGSVAKMSQAEFLEIAWGLANSNQPFLWVVRPGLVQGLEAYEPASIDGYMERIDGRGHIVKWAPQLEVLAHPSVAGFWTHCGWNSTLESICEGVPMICMPFFADQGVNARYVSDKWGVGLRLERGVKRDEVERVMRELMEEEGGHKIRERAMNWKEKAALALKEGGSSYKSLEKLTDYILSL